MDNLHEMHFTFVDAVQKRSGKIDNDNHYICISALCAIVCASALVAVPDRRPMFSRSINR
jgi:hypothetical protein